MKTQFMHPADQLIMIMQRIYERGLTTTSGGNLSIIDDNGDIWITPSGIDKGSLTRRDIMQVKPDGTVIGLHTPSVELPFHSHIYRIRPDVKAILHAHPPTLVAYSLARRMPDTAYLASVKDICGELAMATYEVPGSEKLGEYIAVRFEEGYSTVMMENHGCVIGADSIFNAYRKFETLDFAGRMEIYGGKLGGMRKLNDAQLKDFSAEESKKWPELTEIEKTSEECALRRDLCEFAKRAYRQSLFTAGQGAFAARLSDGSLLVTPADGDNANLEPDEILLVKEGKCFGRGCPGRFASVAQKVFAEHPDISALSLTRAPSIMAFASSDEPFDSRTIPESYIQLRNVARLPFMTSADEVSGAICVKTPVVLLENECAITTGKSVLNAFDRLEVLEYSARAVVMTHDIAPLVRISDKEVRDIEIAFDL